MELPVPVLASRRRLGDRIGDVALHAVAALAGLGSVALVGLIAYRVVYGAWPAIQKFGIAFVWHQTWDPVKSSFGALDFLVGTAVTSFAAVLVAAPLAIAIALFLTELAPPALRGVIGSLVEMLAAVPSVVLGLWGIFVLSPFLHQHVEPFLHRTIGFIPLFGEPSPGGGDMFTAIVVLTIMIVPITASVSRELFKSVPQELKEGAYGLGLTRWEMVRGVVFPYTRGGIVAAVLLGMGRAVGEAIAVTQVIGGLTTIPTSLFQSADTLASRIAAQYQAAATNIHVASIVYLAVVLLAFALLTNLVAQAIVSRFEFQRTGGS
ncbi:MAG TPA: phosphate ABC transporter permease subunit PstC [Gaiellaceae bacterium]|nr:phosphate ABC transporter permease subunit PstC [Gaiellaceae bacterium]